MNNTEFLDDLPLGECFACMYECIEFTYYIESKQFKTLDDVKKALNARAAAYQTSVTVSFAFYAVGYFAIF